MGALDRINKRLANLKPAYDNVEKVLRDDFKDQFENSHGPNGERWAPLKEETLRRGRQGRAGRGDRRSSKPYDTAEHETWDAMIKVGGGKVTKSKEELKIEVKTAGIHQFKRRPVGVSKQAAQNVALEIAKYIVGDD